ncbi:hypothetical protein [Halomarina oriensis]|uniref:Uncharacterized protein n=1 Tax=Halomarina oriensis TaxID=671145 RepID=A0A6B0GLR5_9EURY|nr:hypothetical protein [Halomarina oriensis]MWG34419.1 hypothetical protein [Halomarina oriensis]
MQLLWVLVGLVSVAGGVWSARNPMQARSWASAERWQSDPDSAARDQRRTARTMGGFLVAFGVAVVVWGVLA